MEIAITLAVFFIVVSLIDRGHNAAAETVKDVKYGSAGMVFVITLIATLLILYASFGAIVSVMEQTEPGSSKPFTDVVLELASPD